MVTLEVPTAVEATALFWPRATLLPVTAALIDAPLPRTVDPATPLSVAPKPPTLELAPLTEGAAALAVLLETNGPVEPVTRLLITLSAANSCDPLTASVLEPVTRPAARLVSVRSAPGAPMLTVLDGVVPA